MPVYEVENTLPLRHSLPNIEKNYFDKDKHYREEINKIKQKYQMQRLRGDALNKKIRTHPSYKPVIYNEDYQHQRSARRYNIADRDFIYNRPRC